MNHQNDVARIIRLYGRIPLKDWPIEYVEDLAEALHSELYDRNEALLKWAAERDDE